MDGFDGLFVHGASFMLLVVGPFPYVTKGLNKCELGVPVCDERRGVC